MTAAPIDVVAGITRFLAERLPDARDIRVTLSDIAAKAGFSAETLLFDAAWSEDGGTRMVPMVLKRQIFGHDLLHDADLSLQARVMEALGRHTDLPVPKLIGIEMRHEMLGSPFLVMERLPGRIVPQNPNYHVEGWLADLPVAERAQVWLNGVEAMARVHRVDWREGFAFLDHTGHGAGEPGTQGLPRYIAWIREWLDWALKGRSHPTAEAAMAWLEREMPHDAPVAVLWGDAIPANLLYDDAHRVFGIIDWEFAALAPGEIDLAWWLYFDELFSDGFHVPRLAGLPTRSEVIDAYERAVGRRVAALDYYLAVVGLRMTIVSIRAVDRLVAQGRFKTDNDAWLANPSSAWLARHLALPAVAAGPDFHAFTATLFGKH